MFWDEATQLNVQLFEMYDDIGNWRNASCDSCGGVQNLRHAWFSTSIERLSVIRLVMNSALFRKEFSLSTFVE
jgi:hypothetical protein